MSANDLKRKLGPNQRASQNTERCKTYFALNRYALERVIAGNSSPTFRSFGRARELGVDCRPRDLRLHPVLTPRLNEPWVIKRPSFYVQNLGMDGGYRIQGRSTLRTEVPGQGIAAVSLLGKPSGASSNDLEVASLNLNSDVDAPGASSTVFAVAIVRRTEIAFTLISHAPA